MVIKPTMPILLAITFSTCAFGQTHDTWDINSTEEWQKSCKQSEGLDFLEGVAKPINKQGIYKSVLKNFESKRSAKSIVFEPSPTWLNWESIDNIGPANLEDAPVLLTKGPNDYWMFGMYGSGHNKRHPKPHHSPIENFKSSPAKLEGFDVPLQTTRYKNQFDAPGGLKKGQGGYHAWQSRDMVNWVHHGPVTKAFSRWVTTAEQVDGKTYIYYDYPNDQDPHLYIDEDLTDGVPGQDMGIAFKDPSHGSDCAMIRDKEGSFHVIYEDWSPINARLHSWDSPLAGHAVSKDGVKDFKILNAAVDKRTKPTGEVAEYPHPHWTQHPDWDSNLAKYNVHEPAQEAYGDWAAICIGEQYYLFGDYDPIGKHAMSVAWFTSPSLNEPFEWCGNIGEGHPDPDICFAEGRFYLATQQITDYVSPGPWVGRVEARLGVDLNQNGKIDKWTPWQEVTESYDYLEGFSKQIKRIPAALDLSELPAGYGFCFEFRLEDATANKSQPEIDSVTIQFE